MPPSATGAAVPVHVEPIRAFNDNYIWCIRAGSAAVVVDPGEAAPVLVAAAQQALRLTGILLTHHHNDHIGGVAELIAACGPLPVYGPRDPRVTGAPVIAVGDGDRVELAGLASEGQPAPVLQVLEVPGHTSSHIAFHGELGGEHVLFSGDTLFSIGCGRMFEGTAGQMSASLDRLAALPGDSRVYCGHEYTRANIAFARAVEPDNPDLLAWSEVTEGLLAAGRPTLPSLLATERLANPFLRCRIPSVARSAAAHAGHELAGPVEVFAELRAWKNTF